MNGADEDLPGGNLPDAQPEGAERPGQSPAGGKSAGEALPGGAPAGSAPSTEAPAAEAPSAVSSPAVVRQASGIAAAHLQWHLERDLRSLPLVDRGAVDPVEPFPVPSVEESRARATTIS